MGLRDLEDRKKERKEFGIEGVLFVRLYPSQSTKSICFSLAIPLGTNYQLDYLVLPILRLQEVRIYELVNASQSGLESFCGTNICPSIQTPQSSHHDQPPQY